ncbi:MAG: phosphotransferase [Muribaculaceae bacterium]|nr:phosphotransferase [Muribaculaceae bacterium]
MYVSHFNTPADDISVSILPQAGSDRMYFRMRGAGGSAIATYVPDPKEGRCFVNLADAFLECSRSVPRIYASSDDCRFYLQEDLGDVSLFSLLDGDDVYKYVKAALRALVELQTTPESAWASKVMCKPFSRRQAMWDLNYFKYEYLKQRDVCFDEDALEDDFEHLAMRLDAIEGEFQGFMMRDCQSRNVMMRDGRPVFIDFQGGRKGPVLYDAVSFLWQARAGFSSGFRQEMIRYYAELFCGEDAERHHRMMESLSDLVLFRCLQVLGAYGFRGLIQKRAHFIQSIPGALANLDELISQGALERYPSLKEVCAALVEDSAFAAPAQEPGLTVKVHSFSYKKGYPSDWSGNGGGFAFDCRAMHNPGRYKEYKSLTGRDLPVIEFLEKRGEVADFLRNAWGMTDAAIERYIMRGFSNLQIGFGCTGGQHRSVYCAEATARHIRKLFPEAKVELIHREHPSR